MKLCPIAIVNEAGPVRRKVEGARRIVQQALGDSPRRDQPQAEKYVPTSRPAEPVDAKSEANAFLTPKEAAVRLGMSAGEIGAMVMQETARSMVAEWTVVLPSHEVDTVRTATQ